MNSGRFTAAGFAFSTEYGRNASGGCQGLIIASFSDTLQVRAAGGIPRQVTAPHRTASLAVLRWR